MKAFLLQAGVPLRQVEAVSDVEMTEACYALLGAEHKRKPRPGVYYRWPVSIGPMQSAGALSSFTEPCICTAEMHEGLPARSDMHSGCQLVLQEDSGD